MSFKLYVGNLAFKTSSEDLLKLFASVGRVESVSLIEDRETGRSRGFGFIEMSTRDECRAAIEQFNGRQLFGSVIRVNEARPRYFTPMFDVQERLIDGPEPIERTLYLASQLIAVAYLDQPSTEATLAWPLSEDASLEAVLGAYLTDFLPKHSYWSPNVKLECWINDQYHQSDLGCEPTSLSLIMNLAYIRMKNPGPLNLLQVTSGTSVIELLFDQEQTPESPVRLALLTSGGLTEPLARLFSMFHKNQLVRATATDTLTGLFPDPLSESFKRLLYPLPIYSERDTHTSFESLPHSAAIYSEE